MQKTYETKECEVVFNEIVSKVQEDLVEKYSTKILNGKTIDAAWTDTSTLEFSIAGPLDKEKLRFILIEGVERFIYLINSSEKSRQFIKKYPFNYSEIEGGIIVRDRGNKFMLYPNIAIVLLLRGKIYFNTIDENIEYYGYRTTEEEHYEEALKIVRSKKG